MSPDLEGAQSPPLSPPPPGREERFQVWLQTQTWLHAPSVIIKHLGHDVLIMLFPTLVSWVYEPYVFIALGVALSVQFILNGVLKWVHQAPRPSWVSGAVALKQGGFEPDFSTPSGHASVFACMGTYLMLALPHPATVAFFSVFIPLTGLSRVFLGIHYPHDILYGWACGAAVAAALFFAFRIEDFLALAVAAQVAAPLVFCAAAWTLLWAVKRCIPDRPDALRDQWTLQARANCADAKQKIDIVRRPLSTYTGALVGVASVTLSVTISVNLSGDPRVIAANARWQTFVLAVGIYLILLAASFSVPRNRNSAKQEAAKAALAALPAAWSVFAFWVSAQAVACS